MPLDTEEATVTPYVRTVAWVVYGAAIALVAVVTLRAVGTALVSVSPLLILAGLVLGGLAEVVASLVLAGAALAGATRLPGTALTTVALVATGLAVRVIGAVLWVVAQGQSSRYTAADQSDTALLLLGIGGAISVLAVVPWVMSTFRHLARNLDGAEWLVVAVFLLAVAHVVGHWSISSVHRYEVAILSVVGGLGALVGVVTLGGLVRLLIPRSDLLDL